MPNINELKDRYFVQSIDSNPPSEPVPATFEGNKVTPLVDGEEYFKELKEVISTVGTGASPAENEGQFIYISGWWIHLLGGSVIPAPDNSSFVGPTLGLPSHFNPFSLDSSDGTDLLMDLLKDKANVGVDVRILGWVSWSIMGSAIAQERVIHIHDINVQTISSMLSLRQEESLATKCCFNILGHTAGAVHTKMVIVGNEDSAIGFTGGFDLVSDRHGNYLHTPDPLGGTPWHDIQVKVEGPAVQAIYDFYKDMWNEIKQRDPFEYRIGTEIVPSFVSGTPDLPSRNFLTNSLGTSFIQSLRTLPQFKYVWYNILPEEDPISFAPQGIFEIKLAWQKAIKSAETYIYIEDQSFWSIEVMSWINDAIRNHPNLKVIFMRGVPDQNDPVLPPFNEVALNNGLFPNLTERQIKQIKFFLRGIMIHSKITLIDDYWVLIGSANCARRSLYTDIEHSISILDENIVKDFRIHLWGEHFGLHPDLRSSLSSLDHSLHLWNPDWGSPLPDTEIIGLELPSFIGEKPIPYPPPPPIVLKDEVQEKYDRYLDPDSQEEWGGCPDF